MPLTTTHPDYDLFLETWSRARDVLAGEDAIKAAGERYLRRIDAHTEDEYEAYKFRTAFYNATARTAAGYLGMIFRRAPFLKLPDTLALADFANDADLLGTTLQAYAKQVVAEVIHVGRAGTLIDWQPEEQRAYAAFYQAESIVNWRVGRVGGRSLPTLIVLAERVARPEGARPEISGNNSGTGSEIDEFANEYVEQRRVLKLIPGEPRPEGPGSGATPEGVRFQVELWRLTARPRQQPEWMLVESHVPLRRGEPLREIPFVFHGPRHSRPGLDRPPLEDVIAVNLDHYRLDADYKHGMHFTALPTAVACGFETPLDLKIGSGVAWTTKQLGAKAEFLEFHGHGLQSFERALERDERLMALLGSRLLEGQKRVAETAEALAIRQAGEESILANIATSVSEGITQILRWVHWWSSYGARDGARLSQPQRVDRIQHPNELTSADDQLIFRLNTDFGISGMSARELQAVVAAWQAGALSRDTMLELFRKGEILPDGRTNTEELNLLAK